MKKILALLICMVITLCSASALAADKAPVTINLFHQKQEAQATFAQIIEAFEAEYPHITVEQEIVTNDPAAILKARIATDEIPDIFQGALDTMDIAKGGYIMSLDGEAFLSHINDEALMDSSFTADGHTWALPIDGSCEGIFYNKDIFAQYGLTVPTTLSAFKAVVKTLKDNGVVPFALGFKDSWTIKPITLVAVSPAVYAKDAEWNARKTAGEKSFATDDGWRTTFELLQFVYENGNTATAYDTDYNGACTMVANGEAAMMFQGLWALEPIKSVNPEANLGMMAVPVSETAADAKLFQFPDFGLSISAKTEHPEECKLFFEFLTRTETATLWSSTAKLFSAVKGVDVDFDPLAHDVSAYIAAGMVCTQGDRGWPTVFQPEYDAIMGDFLVNGVSLDDTLAALDAAWDRAVQTAQ